MTKDIRRCAATAAEAGSEAPAAATRGGRLHAVAILAARLLAVVAALAGAGLAATAARAAGRYAALAVDANTGHILHAEAADEPRYPASLTKMMTLYLVFELLEQGRLKPGTPIAVSEAAAATPPSRLGLRAGSTITVADAVRALITKSANDVAVAIAEHVAGSEQRFAELMTREAHELGMSATTFRNPHGLPDRGQVTTARDMVTLGLRLYDNFPVQSRLFATRSFQYGGRIHRNHNTMLDNFTGMEGIKTGYTQASGYNLVASVRRDGRHVVAAVLGGASASARNARMRIVLMRALLRSSPERTRKPMLIARHSEPAALLKRPVPQRVAAVRPAKAAPAAPVAPPPPAPVLVERVAAVGAGAADARSSRRPDPWSSEVRLAAPISGGTSIAGRIGGAGASLPAGPIATRAPSTLTAQAAQLAAHTTVAPPSGRSGGLQVQIGAFSSTAEAVQRLEQARRLSPRLASVTGETPTVHSGGRTLYRARFVGLDQTSAMTVCAELKRQRMDCLIAGTN
ncbi:MAG: D-alanyl-D-alanine carboxypeptidase [Hyphomicrobiaceae bacterium]